MKNPGVVALLAFIVVVTITFVVLVFIDQRTERARTLRKRLPPSVSADTTLLRQTPKFWGGWSLREKISGHNHGLKEESLR